jgi:hypothetical protein
VAQDINHIADTCWTLGRLLCLLLPLLALLLLYSSIRAGCRELHEPTMSAVNC